MPDDIETGRSRGLADLNIWVRLVGAIACMLIIAWGMMIAWTIKEERDLALQQARNLAMTTHQITMANLLFMKVTKTIKKRALYYDQVRQTKAIKDLRVLRGEPVIHEMGDGDEISMTHDALESQVMKTGKPAFQESDDPKLGHVMRAVIPAIASKNYLGKNCMECHEEVKEGDIMGAVSMKISLGELDSAVKTSSINLLAAALLITLPLLAFIYFFVRGVVTRPLSNMATGLKDISNGEGDLTRRLEIRGMDEIGKASGAFNLMMDKLQALIAHVNDTAGRVIASSAELNSRSDTVAHGSATQTERSEGAAQSLEQMSASIANVAEASNRVESLSIHSRERANAGMENMHALQATIERVEQAVAAIASRVENFVTHTSSISAMTQQVKDIADQTNLLALNAAIEAARAGEHGRGFAVVADEVRKLAEKSSSSASEIDQITRALNSESEQVHDAIGTGLSVLQSSHETMVAVSNVLNEAATAVHNVAEGMSEIRHATGEQQQASLILSSSVEQIAELARMNGGAIDEMHSLVQELGALAGDLEGQLGKFKT